uniref:Regulator of microtubule dynamics protein 2 n=1 Tax=Anas zonorhyncha TaxID=75864 RepID=A0A8B9VNI0_9AVES
MSRFENKGLILGIMAGTAGISLVLIWYRKVRKPGAAVRIPDFTDVGNKLNSVGMQHETHNEQGAVMVLHRRQLQILEKLNDLLISVDELKREVKFLKEAIPKLEELVRDELQGKGDAQRVSPSHRAARRRKAETTPAKEATIDNILFMHCNLHQYAKLCKSHSDQFNYSAVLYFQYENCVDFLWRVARAYGDMFEMTADTEEKKKYVSDGKYIKNYVCVFFFSPLRFAIMCGYMSQFESVQNKIRNGYLFKEHLDKAIELKPQDPFLYYLNGRWCYSVAQLSWLEKKVAAALFGTPPTSTVEEALQNFLKVEEMHPGYSKYNYVYLAKCYKDLGQKNNALKYCDSALSVLSVTNEVGLLQLFVSTAVKKKIIFV